MITYNESHYNLADIYSSLSLNNDELIHDYKLIGLNANGSHHVAISYNEDNFINFHFDNFYLTDFLSKSGVKVAIVSDDIDRMNIFLRKDIRENVTLSKCIIETIINLAEGKLLGPFDDFKINPQYLDKIQPIV